MKHRECLVRIVLTLLLASATGCGANATFTVTGSDWRSFVRSRSGSAPRDPSDLRFAPNVCDGEDLRQEFATLDDKALLAFLSRHDLDVRLERQRADLSYAYVSGAGVSSPLRLRIATLANADAAGKELAEAIAQHGDGSWGVHRSNLALLGPVAHEADVIAFLARSKLACWGVPTYGSGADVWAIPGAYTEL